MEDPRADLARFKRDIDYYEGHREELLERYPEQWVAIFDEQVVGVAQDLDSLLHEIKQKGVSPARALIDRVTAKGELLILYRRS